MSVISFANAQELQSAFTNFLNTLNLPQAPKDHPPAAHANRTMRAARKHDRCPADSDSEPAPRRTKKQTRPHAKETKETRSNDR